MHAMTIRDAFGLIKQAFSDWSEDKASRLAAALAYYTVFSIPPLLILTIAIAAMIFGEDTARKGIMDELGSLIGKDAAGAIGEMMGSTSQVKGGNVLATVIGAVILLFGASGVFGELQSSLDTIWEVEAKPDRGILGTIKDRFFSFTMVVGVGFLLLASLIVSAVLAAMDQYLAGLMPWAKIIVHIVNFAVSFGIITFLFALVFKVIPDVKMAWSDVWIGAVTTALLFVIGKYAIGLYLGNSDLGATYKAAASLVVLLIWVYYSAQILFFGAELTQVYANKYGSRIVAAENAQPMTAEARAQQGMHEKATTKPVKEESGRRGLEPASRGAVAEELRRDRTKRPVEARKGDPDYYRERVRSLAAQSDSGIAGGMVRGMGIGMSRGAGEEVYRYIPDRGEPITAPVAKGHSIPYYTLGLVGGLAAILKLTQRSKRPPNWHDVMRKAGKLKK